jgi:hypothetical protein
MIRKTTLLQTMLRTLDSQTVARVMNTMLDPRELLESAMIDLGGSRRAISCDAESVRRGLAERAAMLAVGDRQAQNLTLPALEEIGCFNPRRK